MNRLSFKFEPCPDSNDHEIRVLVDQEDVVGKSFLGLDPPSFFAQNFDVDGTLLIGRCNCGVEGCSDFRVTVAFLDDVVRWTSDNGLKVSFPRTHYLEALDAARNDHSWEDVKRTSERIAQGILSQTRTRDGFEFDWASTRIKKAKITLSYSKQGMQKLLEICWDGKVQSVEPSVKLFAQENLEFTRSESHDRAKS
jgi:hypothetical protein